jgi:RND family efflux transporter MFP subunit
MSQKTKFLKVAIPIIIIIVGILIMKVLTAGRPEPKKEVKKDPGILAQVLKTEKKDTEIIVKGTGTVEAAQEVSVIPQVSGRAVYTAPDLVVGGFFRTDEILFKIEDSDYTLAVTRSRAAMAKSEYDLATIESQARIARTEWERINKDNETQPNPLVLFEPQLKNAKAALQSAAAALEQAKLDLERTKVKAPFNSIVRSENIDIGQYVKSGGSVAVLAGTDEAEIAVPLPMDDLRWLDIPRHGKRQNGASASLRLSVGGESYEWSGRVVRSTGEVDSKNRMMKLIVEVKDPYGLKDTKDSAWPALAAGTFVNVQITGRMLKDVFVIPRTALRDNSTVWIMDRENKLHIKKVSALRLEKDEVIISEGLLDGDMIVLTNISGAVNGMKLRRMKEKKNYNNQITNSK